VSNVSVVIMLAAAKGRKKLAYTTAGSQGRSGVILFARKKIASMVAV